MGMRERLYGSGWFAAQAKKESLRDALPTGERIGQGVGIVINVLVIAFFVVHQTRPTHFFTDEFRTFQMVVFYVVLVLGIVPMLVRLITNRRNDGRLWEAVNMALFAAGGLYLLVLWPFDFSHFAEPLPRALEPALEWITDSIARWVIGIGVAASAFFAPYTFLLYGAVRSLLVAPHQAPVQEDSGDEPPKGTP